MKLSPLLLALICISSSMPQSQSPAPELMQAGASPSLPPSLYEQAVIGTDIPPDLFRALAMAESDEMDSATGDDGASIGRFQINETFRAERVRLYGEYDPRNPVQAARVAAGILQEHYARFGSWSLALTAYNAGAGYALKHGNRMAYINRVQMMLERIGSRLVITDTLKGLAR